MPKETYYENEYMQIAPAPPGWRVMYKGEGGKFYYSPVACFALVHRLQKRVGSGLLLEDEGLVIHPIVGGEVMESPVDYENFVAILGPGDDEE